MRILILLMFSLHPMIHIFPLMETLLPSSPARALPFTFRTHLLRHHSKSLPTDMEKTLNFVPLECITVEVSDWRRGIFKPHRVWHGLYDGCCFCAHACCCCRSGYVWEGGVGAESAHQEEEDAECAGTAFPSARGNHPGTAVRSPTNLRLDLLPLKRLQGVKRSFAWFHCRIKQTGDFFSVYFTLPFDTQPIDRNVSVGGESSWPGGEVAHIDPPPVSPATLSRSPKGQGTWEEQCSRKGIIFTALPHLADLMTWMIKGIIDFSKGLHEFR